MSWIWKHFVGLSTNEAQCKYCSARYNTKRTTASLRYHLKTNHSDLVQASIVPIVGIEDSADERSLSHEASDETRLEGLEFFFNTNNLQSNLHSIFGNSDVQPTTLSDLDTDVSRDSSSAAGCSTWTRKRKSKNGEDSSTNRKQRKHFSPERSAPRPGSKDSNLQNVLPSTRDTDVRDQICNKNDLINMANEAFGNDKWNHVITNQILDFVENVTGKYYVGCATFIKVQLADGCFHEDLGYSNSEGHNKGLTILSARTGSITNALRNTLLCFGGEIATKITNVIQLKGDVTSSIISAISEPQRIVIPKPRIAPPQAQSTPEKQKPSALTIGLGIIENDNQANSSGNNNERKIQSPQCLKPVENGARIDKAALTDEERRLERKRRQAQKQEEYRRLLKEKESTERANARF